VDSDKNIRQIGTRRHSLTELQQHWLQFIMAARSAAQDDLPFCFAADVTLFFTHRTLRSYKSCAWALVGWSDMLTAELFQDMHVFFHHVNKPETALKQI